MGVTTDAIVDAAIRRGEADSWEAVRLFHIAEDLGTDLDEIRRHFREKEELVEAWFDRADQALLQAAGMPAITALPSVERIEALVMAWLAALEPHRRVTRQMIVGKLEFGHLHVQIPAVLRISRTVQWLREAAGRDAAGVYRGLEETVLTSLFVSTFAIWLRAPGDHAGLARGYLHRGLRGARRLSRWVPGYASRHTERRYRLPAPDASGAADPVSSTGRQETAPGV